VARDAEAGPLGRRLPGHEAFVRRVSSVVRIASRTANGLVVMVPAFVDVISATEKPRF